MSIKDMDRGEETPPYFSRTFLFVTLMLLGLLLMEGSLIRITISLKKKNLVILFIVSFLSSLSMGYLSSRDFTLPVYNWIGECVNTLGQSLFFLASLIMQGNGLGEDKKGEDHA